MSFHPNDVRFLVGVLNAAREQPGCMPYQAQAIDDLVEYLESGDEDDACGFCGFGVVPGLKAPAEAPHV